MAEALRHLVIDGSNIATEGRSLPSLAQLDEAVRALVKERPFETWTVVVDATFGHRIDASEKPLYEEALAANELVTPPAGTIGRGDKFLLEIADRSGATVFSNDSFQEFHGEYDWLFDEGRLIGGKPVPEVGWIFTERTPVRGPKSRMATRGSDRRGRLSASGRGSGSRRVLTATGPPPVPTQPPPRAPRREPVRAERSASSQASAPDAGSSEPVEPRRKAPVSARRSSTTPQAVNEPLPFIEFIAEHAPGQLVEGEVLTFTSHGAFVQVGGVRCYLALKFMGDPAPRSARDVLARGEIRSFVVQAIDAPRRGIDLALPGFEAPDDGGSAGTVTQPEIDDVVAAVLEATDPAAGDAAAAEAVDAGTRAVAAGPRRRTRARPVAATPVEAHAAPAAASISEDRPSRARRSRSATLRAEQSPVVSGEATATLGPATSEDEVAADADSEAATAKRSSVKKAPAKRAPAKKASAKKAGTKKEATTKKPATKKPAGKKAPIRKAATPATTEAATTEAATTEAATTEAGTTEAGTTEAGTTEAATVTKKAATKKAVTTKAATKKAATKKAATKKAVTKKAATKKAATKKAVTTTAATKKAASGSARKRSVATPVPTGPPAGGTDAGPALDGA